MARICSYVCNEGTNEINNIPNALISALKAFTDNGGSLIIIPSKDHIKSSYNALFSKKVLYEVCDISGGLRHSPS